MLNWLNCGKFVVAKMTAHFKSCFDGIKILFGVFATDSDAAGEPTAKKNLKEVKKLIDLGKEKGYLTYDDVNDMLPAEAYLMNITLRMKKYLNSS